MGYNSTCKLFPWLYTKTFIALVIAFVLVFLCIYFFLTPNTLKSYPRIYHKPYLLQTKLNDELKGKTLAEISQYLQTHEDEPMRQAYVLTRHEILTPYIASHYGLHLKDGMRFQILQGHPFLSGKTSHFSAGKNHRFLLKIFSSYRRTNNNDEGSQPKLENEYPHVRVFSLDEFCTFDDFLTYVYYFTYHKPNVKYACRHPNPAVIVIPIHETPYVIVIRRPIYSPPQMSVSSIVLATSFSLLILLTTVFILLFPLLLSIQRVRETCQKVCEGDFTARCTTCSTDVMRDLKYNVNEMTSVIERHLTQQKSLLQAVSHELRTPLSRIRFSLEMLDVDENDESTMARLASIDEDLSEIDHLVHELSYFNYVDSKSGHHQFETHTVKDLVETTIHQRSHLLLNLDVQQEGFSDDLVVYADPMAFKRVIGNLLSNAARYAKTTIRITARHTPDTAIELTIEDDGLGIPESYREQIFEPFFCLDASRSKSNNGFGLGLAIAHSIMKLHHGSIRAERSDLGGLRMITVWPTHADQTGIS